MSEYEVIDGFQDRAALRSGELVKAPDGNIGTIISLGKRIGSRACDDHSFAVVEFRADWRVEYRVSELRRRLPPPPKQDT